MTEITKYNVNNPYLAILYILNYFKAICWLILKQLGLLQISRMIRLSGSPVPEGHISFCCPDNCVPVLLHSFQLRSCDAVDVFVCESRSKPPATPSRCRGLSLVSIPISACTTVMSSLKYHERVLTTYLYVFVVYGLTEYVAM